MKYLAILFLLFSFSLSGITQKPAVSSGQIKHFENFPSVYITPRQVDVWLPPGYSPSKKYAVLYMHDGQMLFDSTITWNKKDWQADEVATKLIGEKKIQPCIIVGIWNLASMSVGRHSEYFPQKPFEKMSVKEKDSVISQLQQAGRTKADFKPVSDNYLKFIVRELKPFIDSAFSTRKEKKSTLVAGSSMGGLISMYAICEYPDVFGGAACLSTHWPGTFTIENNPVPAAFFEYMKSHLPDPVDHKIYFDYGDQTLDALYPLLQKKADEIMKVKGYTTANWLTRYFPGENHSETAWAKRLDIPLLFLLKK
jgi:enterochelin esterase-like enzyme